MITSYICSGTLLVFLSFTLFRVINHVHSQRLLILLLGMLFISNVFRLINVQITEIESCKNVNIVSLNTVLAVTTYFEYTPRNLTYWILASKYYQLSSSVYSLMNGGEVTKHSRLYFMIVTWIMIVLILVSEIIPSIMLYFRENPTPSERGNLVRNLFFGSEWLNFALNTVSTVYLVVSFKLIAK